MTSNRSMTTRWGSLSVASTILAGILLCAGCSAPPRSDAFEIGMSRDEVVARFGEPRQRASLRKTEEPIWGAIETFWTTVPAGSLIEIWHYPVQDGTIELYFVDRSDTVRGMGFAPEGAVFEATPADSV